MLRPPPFRYHRPDTVQDAVSLLAEYAETAIPVSGGTDLIPNMKHRLFTPAHLVALKGVGELKGIREKDGELVIGAAATLADVSLHPSVRLHFTALSEAAGRVAGPQLRNSGTLGGPSLSARSPDADRSEAGGNVGGGCGAARALNASYATPSTRFTLRSRRFT